ncbi:MAG: ABC transporter ATP-binding protein [Planifilum fulgidum]
MEEVAVLDQVSKAYPGFRLGPLSLTLRKGYIHGFIGANGAGKTTTIKLMMNLIRPDAGRIQLFGLDHRANEREIKERIGFVYADNHFYDDLTVDQIKRITASIYRRWDEEAFQGYLKRFSLPPHKKIKHLSRGMKMKLSIALALSHHAELIIMDEPTSGLDPVVRHEILELMAELIQDGEKTIFFSTHITSDLERIADYITFIHEGRLCFSLTREEIPERYRIVKGEPELLDADKRKLFLGLRETPYGFEGLTDDPEGARAAFRDKVLYEAPSLEEIMVYTIKGDARSARGDVR